MLQFTTCLETRSVILGPTVGSIQASGSRDSRSVAGFRGPRFLGALDVWGPRQQWQGWDLAGSTSHLPVLQVHGQDVRPPRSQNPQQLNSTMHVH